MNLKRILLTLMAAAVAFVSCNQEEELGMANLTVTPGELTFDQSDGTSEVELLATRDWLIASQPDWVAVSVTGGQASTKPQKVSVSVIANSGYNRTGTVVFTIGIMKAALTINQAGAQGEIKLGTGTKEDPYTVAGVIKYVQGLGADVESPDVVYFKGKVTSVATTFAASGTYGNATFYIADEPGGDTFYCFQSYYLGNRKWNSGDTEIKADDEVIMCGKVVNYKGNTPETVGKGGSFIYSLNGKTEGGGTGGDPGTPKGKGTLDDPYNPAGAAAYAKSLGSDVQSPVSIYIKGKISKVGTTFAASGNYGNATFNIVDASDGTGDFYVYQTYYLGNRQWKSGDTEVKEGDEVIICGPVINYKGNTPETVGKGASYIYSLNGKTEGGDNPGGGGGGETGTPKGTGTQADPYNAAAAISVASALEAGAKSGDVYIAGKISSIKYTFSAQYGTATFNISDDGTTSGSQLTCYSVLYLGNRSWVDGDTQVKEGDDVIIYGKLTNYQGNTPETASKEAYVYSLNGVTEGGDPTPPGPGTGGGDYSSNVSMTKGTSCYDDNKLTVNGTDEVPNLKFGTSSKYGDGTVVLPAGTTEVSFYAIAWKGADASLKFSIGDSSMSFDVAANDGASGSGPYVVTVTDTDKYSFKFDSPLAAETSVKVETYAGNKKGYRAFLFGVKAVK